MTVLLLEVLALTAATVYFIIELLVSPPASIGSAIAIIVLVSIGAIWVSNIAIGVLHGKAWTRAAIVVVQVLATAIAIGTFQGSDARPLLGVVILVPAVVAVVLLFSRPVLAATSAGGRDDRTF